MSAGLMCQRCRRYLHAPEQGQMVRTEYACACLSPQPSWDDPAADPGDCLPRPPRVPVGCEVTVYRRQIDYSHALRMLGTLWGGPAFPAVIWSELHQQSVHLGTYASNVLGMLWDERRRVLPPPSTYRTGCGHAAP